MTDQHLIVQIDYVDDLSAWLKGSPETWAADIARVLHDYPNRRDAFRLLRAQHDGNVVGFLLYELLPGRTPTYLHYAATDPVYYRRGVATQLFNRMFDDVERPIEGTGLTREGRIALAKWGFEAPAGDWVLL